MVDKQKMMDRLSGSGLVTPVLPEGRPDTVRDIPTLTEYIGQQLSIGGEAAINAGKGLIEAKQQMKHGEWQDWLAENFGLSDRQARRLMVLAQNYGDSKRTPVSVLGQRKALALLALPESEREEFLSETHRVNGEEKTVIDMTSRELERAIKERDEARKAAEQAKTDARAAQEARQSMEERLKAANTLMGRSKVEADQAASRVAELERQVAELKAAPVEVAVMEADQAAIDKARAEGEAAKAAEVAALQEQLKKAKESQRKAEEDRGAAEEALAGVKSQMEELSKAQRQTAALSDPDVAKFQVYFDQVQESVNKMRGVLLKVKGREDPATAEKLTCAILALGEAVKGAAQ